jgi:citrate synthase
MLESDEAARRLGVKVATLYAYVSRGLLTSHPAATSRRSLFDMDEVEGLARRSRQGKTTETRMATVTTGITQLTEEGPLYRGRPATELATAAPFEAVAEWLWCLDPETGAEGPPVLGTAGPPGPTPPAWCPAPIGPAPAIGSSDRLAWAVLMCGATTPLRADLRPEAVGRMARQLCASMVEVLPEPPGEPGAEGVSTVRSTFPLSGSIAERLANKLSARATEGLVVAVNAALVLLADHELATSTMAVRVAASTRADVADAVLAGLATLAGPLHGGASQQAYALLAHAEQGGPEEAMGETLRWQGVLPGFGHSVYPAGDPRFDVLYRLVSEVAPADRVAFVGRLVGIASEHGMPPPNVDLGLAAMTWAMGLASDAGRTLFAVARTAGWVAHYLEELAERPLRYRARAVYASGRA